MSQAVLNISLSELCQLEGIESDVIVALVEYEIAVPIAGINATEWIFATTSVPWIKKAVRLSQDLEIDWVAVALVIELMQQKEALQNENRRYQQQLQRFVEE